MGTRNAEERRKAAGKHGGHADGSGKEGQAAGQDGLAAVLQRLLGSFLRGAAIAALLVITGGHQDGVVHSRAQLDGTDDDAGDEGQLGTGEVRDAHIDGDGGLDAGNQQHRDGQAPEGDQDDGSDCHDRSVPCVGSVKMNSNPMKNNFGL